MLCVNVSECVRCHFPINFHKEKYFPDKKGVCLPTDCRRLCEEASISMSSYGAPGAWDGGPPGAEADYATQRAPPLGPPMPTTDPWTGVSYSSYGQPNFDYQQYAPTGYGYNYDSGYYSRSDGYYKYPDTRDTYSAAPSSYDYAKVGEPSCSPGGALTGDRRHTPYKSKSRSVSPYKSKDRSYSRKRDSSYEESSRKRHSKSRSKSRHAKYSSSDRTSSRSRSYSRSPLKKNTKSSSSELSHSDKSYVRRSHRNSDHSLTPPIKKSMRHSHKHSRTPSRKRNAYKKGAGVKREKVNRKERSYSSKEKRQSKTLLIRKLSETPPKAYKKVDSSSATPKAHKRSDYSLTPPRKYKSKGRRSPIPQRKPRESSVTPPKCYARTQSCTSSDSNSSMKRLKHTHSGSPQSNHSRSRSVSSHSSRSVKHSRSKSDHQIKHDSAKRMSRSKGNFKHYSESKSRSQSRGRSSSRGKGRRSASSKSKSRSRSHSGTPSDDERRGQFTVADRKRFWKMHRSRQEEMERTKSPQKEIKPPPGAVESTTVDDIKYGDPPEIEGPNFAEVLPTREQVVQSSSSTSKSKPIALPIKNDGSFLEMFKKMQEVAKPAAEPEKKPIKKPVLPFIGKRRGGRVLKTGLVKKAKAIDEQTVDNTPKDAWSLYMQEVKKYRETSCEEERKTRPLVK